MAQSPVKRKVVGASPTEGAQGKYPNGEGAVLKTVSPQGPACSNHALSAKAAVVQW